MTVESNSQPKSRLWRVALLLGLGVALSILARWYWIDSWTEAGTIGDYFGLIGSLANTAALLIAFSELALQRQELRNTVQAQRDQATAQAKFSTSMDAMADATRALSANQDRANTLQELAIQAQNAQIAASEEQALATYLSTYLQGHSNAYEDGNFRVIYKQFAERLVTKGILVKKAGSGGYPDIPPVDPPKGK